MSYVFIFNSRYCCLICFFVYFLRLYCILYIVAWVYCLVHGILSRARHIVSCMPYCLVHGILSSRRIVISMYGRFGVLQHIVTSVNCRVDEQSCRSAVAGTCSSVSVNVPVIQLLTVLLYTVFASSIPLLALVLGKKGKHTFWALL